MAGLTHLGVALASKTLVPKIHLGFLILAAYTIDLLWIILWGIRYLFAPNTNPDSLTPWTHGLFMATLWSWVSYIGIWVITKDRNVAMTMSLVVFSHWVIDFISHPMTAVMPDDGRLPVFFDGSTEIGLGLWSTKTGVIIGEYVTVSIALVIYLRFLMMRINNKQIG